MMVGPDSFGRVIAAVVESTGLTRIELSLEPRVDAQTAYRAGLEWVPLPVLFGLAQAAGWTKDRLATEFDWQLGPQRREQGWRSPRVHAQQEAG